MTEAICRVYPPGYGHTPGSADYQPWLADQDFLAAWRTVRDHTLVDLPRLYGLWELVGQLHRGSSGVLLEVGAWRGGSAALMALRLRSCNDQRRVYVADTFSGVVKAGERDSYYRGGEHADTSLDTVQGFLDDLALHQCRVLPGVFPDETGSAIVEPHVAFCHIDVDVYQSARDVFYWAWERMAPGGIAVLDDYGFHGCDGVTDLVHELRNRTDLVCVPGRGGHAVMVRVA